MTTFIGVELKRIPWEILSKDIYVLFFYFVDCSFLIFSFTNTLLQWDLHAFKSPYTWINASIGKQPTVFILTCTHVYTPEALEKRSKLISLMLLWINVNFNFIHCTKLILGWRCILALNGQGRHFFLKIREIKLVIFMKALINLVISISFVTK